MRRILLPLGMILCALAGNAGRAGDAPPPAPPEIAWEDNSLKAFTKAVEQNKPLVVLFGNPPKFRSEKGTNLTNDIRKELNDPAVRALQGRAIFTLGFPDEDEFARRMALHLKLTDYPTLSVIAPRTDQLTEAYRMEGFFKAADIAKDLNAALPAAPAGANPPAAPGGPAADAKADQKELSKEEEKGIFEAVDAYERALKAGDLDQVIKLTAQPFGFVYEQGVIRLRAVGRAKHALLAAMDQKFGAQADTIPYGPDDERLRQRMKKLDELSILDYRRTGLTVALEVEAKLKNGRTEQWKLVANRPAEPGGKWMVWPHSADAAGEIGTSETWQKNMEKLAAAYDAVAADIGAGKYATREQARQAAFAAYSRAISPNFGQPPAGK